METSVSASAAGQIVEVRAKSGDSVTVGDVLVTLA
jgi:oxaloacetate decarboxylase alpha subunit